MFDLPSKTLTIWNQTLSNCDELETDQKLSTVFACAELSMYRDRIPQTLSLKERVASLANYLIQQGKNRQGEWAILLFLEILRDKYAVDHGMYQEIEELSRTISRELPSVAINAGISHEESFTIPDHSDYQQQQSHRLNSETGKEQEDLSEAKAVLDRIELMFYNKLLTRDQLSILNQLYSQAQDIYNPNVPVNLRDKGVVDTMSNSSVLPDKLASDFFVNTSRSLAFHIKALAKHQREWPNLYVGDYVTTQSIETLKVIQNQLLLVSNIVEKYTPLSKQQVYKKEREGAINTAKKLASLFEQVDIYLASGRLPDNIQQQMEMQLDNLVFYTSRCLLWLNDLAVETDPRKSFVQ